MKKTLSLVCILAMLICTLAGCGSKAPAFTEKEWVFSKLVAVSVLDDLDQELLEEYYADYEVETKDALAAAFLAELEADGVYAPCYIRFDTDSVAFWDVIMEREATLIFYSTEENKGFLSPLADLDASAGNPDPLNNQTLSYDAESDTLTAVCKYAAFKVTVEYKVK